MGRVSKLRYTYENLGRQANLGQTDAFLKYVELGVACAYRNAGRLLLAREDETISADADPVGVLGGGAELAMPRLYTRIAVAHKRKTISTCLRLADG